MGAVTKEKKMTINEKNKLYLDNFKKKNTEKGKARNQNHATVFNSGRREAHFLWC